MCRSFAPFPECSLSNICSRTDTWPKNLTLNPCKEPLKDNTELPLWIRRHKPRLHLMRFGPSPRAPDGSVNEQKFHAIYKFMAEHRVVCILYRYFIPIYSLELQYAFGGWQLPSGKFSYNIVIFPVASTFIGAVFPDGIPDLPGSGNALDVQFSAGEAKPQPLSGISLPPAFIARMQGLEPAKQKQLLAHFLRAQQQEQLRRQQLQQTQQPHAASSQALNSFGISTPSNPFGTVVNVPVGLHVSTL